MRIARGVIKRLFAWLHAAGYLRINPNLLIRQRRKDNPVKGTTVERAERIRGRYLPREFRRMLVEALNHYPRCTLRENNIYERDRYVLHLFLYLTLRLGEAASHGMGDFYQNSHGQWFLCVTGKGEKTRLVPANSRFMVALQRYRRYLGLPDYPEPGETTAFIPSIDGERRITDRQIHNIIKQMIHNAVVELRTVNKHVAEELRHASAHWFRQTSNTTLVNAGVDRRFRKAHAGRSNNATAAIYEHIEQEDIYQAMEIVDVGLDGLVD